MKKQLLAPNGKPSKLTPEQYKLVRTPAFKNFFGDWENDPENSSKVIDEETKEPLVVYHGTNNEFTTFKLGYGSYSSFTENKRLALSYGDVVNSFFLSIKNPYIINGGGQWIWRVIGESHNPESFFGGTVPFSNDGIIFKDVIDFNGVLGSKYVFDVSNVIMVRKNTQIKLADGSNTTFDANNPDIRFNKGGELELDVEKVEKIKSLILKNFPYLESLYLIGKGLNGYAFVTEINNEVYVVKYSTSITEYWLTKMASVSNPPNVVKFEEVKEISDNFEYIIIHKWLNRDAMPNKNAWEVALGNDFKGYREGIKFIDKKELEYVMKLSKKLNKSLEDYFGFTIDTNQDNWGYDENNKLLLFDLDGNVSKSQYEIWMNKHSDSSFEKGGEVNTGLLGQIWGWFGIKF